MGVEIERKFLVTGDQWRTEAQPVIYRQGYLNLDQSRTVRVRVAAEQAYLTIKGAVQGVSRAEFEYEIPKVDAEQMFKLCQGSLIEKTRSKVQHEGHLWEVDEFLGDNKGLIIAEIELQTVDEPFVKPDWIGEEVSEDSRYFNSRLVETPYCQW